MMFGSFGGSDPRNLISRAGIKKAQQAPTPSPFAALLAKHKKPNRRPARAAAPVKAAACPFLHLAPAPAAPVAPTAAERAQAKAAAIVGAAARAGAPVLPPKPAAGSVAAQIIAAAAKARRPQGEGDPEAVRVAKGGR